MNNNVINLLPAADYRVMVDKVRRQSAALLDRASRVPSTAERDALLKRVQALQSEAIELEMRRLASMRGETTYVPGWSVVES